MFRPNLLPYIFYAYLDVELVAIDVCAVPATLTPIGHY